MKHRQYSFTPRTFVKKVRHSKQEKCYMCAFCNSSNTKITSVQRWQVNRGFGKLQIHCFDCESFQFANKVLGSKGSVFFLKDRYPAIYQRVWDESSLLDVV